MENETLLDLDNEIHPHSNYTGVIKDGNIDSVLYGVEDGPSADPTEDGVVQFEAPTVPLTLEQDADLSRELTSKEFGIDQYVNGLQVLARFGYT